KEGVAISGAPFFAYFLWQDKESESPPAGGETRDAPPTKKKTKNKKSRSGNPPERLFNAPNHSLSAQPSQT
ncbi:hypothetical protein, partial [Ralstonia mannitolilytica]|uniref:hypothetical protein n=1 Tax=Ralstonia mannitolilytica TaxID=105219 RepID=UPI0029302222